MFEALREVREEGISMHQSALRHNITRTTLSDRVRGIRKDNCKLGEETILTDA